MNRNKYHKKPRQSRIDRLEKKCDLILCELSVIRQRLSSARTLDDVIDTMHRRARRMRELCDRERETVLRLSRSKQIWP